MPDLQLRCSICTKQFLLDETGGVVGDVNEWPVSFCVLCWDGIVDLCLVLNPQWHDDDEDWDA